MEPLGKALETPAGAVLLRKTNGASFQTVLLYGPAVCMSTESRGDAAICQACPPTYQMNRAI